MSRDDNFVNSEAFGAIYFYSYVLVSFVIIFGAYHFASKVRLFYDSYKLLESIEKRLGNITIAINALELKYDCQIEHNNKKFNKVKFIDVVTIEHLINQEFDEITDLINIHKTQLIEKVHQIDQAGKNRLQLQLAATESDDETTAAYKNDQGAADVQSVQTMTALQMKSNSLQQVSVM